MKTNSKNDTVVVKNLISSAFDKKEEMKSKNEKTMDSIHRFIANAEDCEYTVYSDLPMSVRNHIERMYDESDFTTKSMIKKEINSFFDAKIF
jgi:ribosomal protein S13